MMSVIESPYAWARPCATHLTGEALADLATWQRMDVVLPTNVVRAIMGYQKATGSKMPSGLSPVGKTGMGLTNSLLFARSDVEELWRRRCDWFERLDACPPGHILCSKCWQHVEQREFVGRAKLCRSCRLQKQAAWRDRNREYLARYSREWQRRGRRELREGLCTPAARSAAAYREYDRERMIARYRADPEAWCNRQKERRAMRAAVQDGVRSPITGRSRFVLACWQEGQGWRFRAARLDRPLGHGEWALLLFTLFEGQWVVSEPQIVAFQVRSMVRAALAYWRGETLQGTSDQCPDAPIGLARRVA